MPYNHLFVRAVLVATVICCAAGSAGGQTSLNAMLEPFLARYQLPALAAASAGLGPQATLGKIDAPRALN